MKDFLRSHPERLLPLCLAAFLLVSCARTKSENEVIVVSPHWDGIKDETSRAFAAWHLAKYGRPAVIRWRDAGGGTSQILRFLKADYAAHASAGIDVLYGGGVDPFHELEKEGLLTRYDPPADILAQIPARLNGMDIIDPNHQWFGVALSGFGIITNERARAALGLPEVHTWEGLTDPRLAGWISASDPRSSGSVLAIYEIILQSYGWDKGWRVLMEMSANARHFLSSAAASSVEVGIGDAAYGVAIDTYGNAQAGFYGTQDVSFTLPEGQTVITPDSIAIMKNPPHPEMAQHFLEFVLSHDGQLLWMEPKGVPGGSVKNVINRMSVQPAIYTELAGKTPILTNPFQMRSTFVYSNDLGSKRRAILSVLIAAWMIDTHDFLIPTWKALNGGAGARLTAEKRQGLLEQLVAPPFSLDELLKLAATDWKDPIKRTGLIDQWQSDAIQRDKTILAELHSGG